MDIKTLLGDAYHDDMTVEEINTALADKELVDPATLPKSVDKTVFDKTASELSHTKKELKKLQGDSMTADEKLKAELQKAKDAQSTYAKELSKLRAKEIFTEGGLTEKDYGGIIDALVSEDEEITKTNATNMVALIKAQRAATEKAVKAQMIKDTPEPPAGEGAPAGNDFDKMTLTEKIKLKVEQPDVYEKLSGGSK